MVLLDDDGGEPYNTVHEFLEKYGKDKEHDGKYVGSVQCMQGVKINDRCGNRYGQGSKGGKGYRSR